MTGLCIYFYSLVDVLDAFLDQNDLQPIPHFVGEFPEEITVAQTIAAWKYIVEYQERQK